MNYNRPIAIGLFPNTRLSDSLLALKILFSPHKWRHGDAIEKVGQWFQNEFPKSTVYYFNAGRSAEYFILKSFGIGSGDEVVVQAFTCVAVPNSIIWAGAKPVYVDIDETGNVDPSQLEKKITPRTKAIIVQHTFGISAQIEKIQEICQKHKMLLIEDCAHALGASYNGKLLGSFGDAAFFSFGRDKVISSVFGGIALFKNLNQKAIDLYPKIELPSHFWIFQQLMHPIAAIFVLPLYFKGKVGQYLLWFLQKIKLLSFPVYPQEKFALKPIHFPKKFPNALAILALNQLSQLSTFNAHRKNCAARYQAKLSTIPITLPKYQDGDIFLRFNILCSEATELRFYAKKKDIILGNWYHSCVDPSGTDFSKIYFADDDYPTVRTWARQSVNLPTYPTLSMEQVDEIIELVQKFYAQKE